MPEDRRRRRSAGRCPARRAPGAGRAPSRRAPLERAARPGAGGGRPLSRGAATECAPPRSEPPPRSAAPAAATADQGRPADLRALPSGLAAASRRRPAAAAEAAAGAGGARGGGGAERGRRGRGGGACGGGVAGAERYATAASNPYLPGNSLLAAGSIVHSDAAGPAAAGAAGQGAGRRGWGRRGRHAAGQRGCDLGRLPRGPSLRQDGRATSCEGAMAASNRGHMLSHAHQ